MALAKMKAGVNSSLFGCGVSSKTSPLSYIVKFCCCCLVTVFPRSFWSPILGMGCRCQSPKFPTIFDCESQRSKTATDFSALEFPEIAQMTSRRDPMFTLAVIRHVPEISKTL